MKDACPFHNPKFAAHFEIEIGINSVSPRTGKTAPGHSVVTELTHSDADTQAMLEYVDIHHQQLYHRRGNSHGHSGRQLHLTVGV